MWVFLSPRTSTGGLFVAPLGPLDGPLQRKGPYKGRAPTGELLEMYGMAMAKVDENLKIKSIDVHYDPNQLLMKLEGKEC